MSSRLDEINKYHRSYQDPNYGMGALRQHQAKCLLRRLMPFSSYLDVSCGRGEMIEYASELGVSDVMGSEVVDYLLIPGKVVYGESHDLPFSSDMFDVVSSFDLLEHLNHSDVRDTLSEIMRIAKYAVVLTISNTSSIHLGRELHVTRLPYDEWHQCITETFDGWDIAKLESSVSFNRPWIIQRVVEAC